MEFMETYCKVVSVIKEGVFLENMADLSFTYINREWKWARTGRRAGEGRCSCRCITSPASRAAPRRPIAKFNAKVMRARVRLRAAMQERPATGVHLTVSSSPTTAPHTASPELHAFQRLT
ncbi:uncharacterized protein LOC114249327 [Bombyx mandarina]|uniref:Uncharacterized protein LOC114249327 n=1 Tax=Bombyx mandarina TaxID=7092 RepID=A0A6J2K8P4_BOMMA|nr:uncharacterized protein LOC114249327 [Bombyx mandarina]